MKIAMIASGSKGNLCYLKTKDASIIIDTGISNKRLQAYFLDHKIDSKIDAILITHEHTDHISGLAVISKTLGCPVYMTRGTKDGILRKNADTLKYASVRVIHNQETFYINNTKITAIPTFHDAIDPCGYKVDDGDNSLVYITDTGYIHSSLLGNLCNASIYVMETNHDPDMLMSCEKRPYETRVRILGDHGHLSNEDGLYNLCHIIGDRTKLVFYAHISEDCNLVELIDKESKKMFKKMEMDVSNIKFVYTSQIPSKVYEV